MWHRLLLTLVFLTPAAYADNPETMSERSQTQARAVLDRAVDAVGGAEALRAIDVVRLTLEGDTWPRMQMTTPAAPFEAGTQRETLLIDFKNNRMRLEQQGSGAGFDNHNTIIIRSGEGVNYDQRGHTEQPIPVAQSTQQQFVQFYRRIPNLLLRQAIDRTATVRYLGQDTYDGKAQDVITFVMPDTQQVAVYVDKDTNLVTKYDLLFVDPLTGDEANEVVFGDYKTLGKYRVPQAWAQRQAGEAASKFKLGVEINPAISDASFAAPPGKFAKIAPQPANLDENIEKLADGVYVIQNVAGQNQNTMAVEFKDYIVAIEAPGSSDGADQVIAKIKERIPGKPIRYVAMTHHHGDHIGGLRSFIAEGSTVITTPGNRAIVQAMAAAPQIDRLAKHPRTPEILLIEKGKRVLTDGVRTVELIDVGPNPHAKEMVIAYLPRERIVFQGDLFFAPTDFAPPGPPQPTTLSFAKRAKELKLAFDRIASVHGRTGTAAELEAQLKLAEGQELTKDE
jgi:glyoxylase-like metal-dependent hydrolase (beta-lactamase superfamily II)